MAEDEFRLIYVERRYAERYSGLKHEIILFHGLEGISQGIIKNWELGSIKFDKKGDRNTYYFNNKLGLGKEAFATIGRINHQEDAETPVFKIEFSSRLLNVLEESVKNLDLPFDEDKVKIRKNSDLSKR